MNHHGGTTNSTNNTDLVLQHNPNWPASIAARILPHDFEYPPSDTNSYQLALDLAPYPILISSLEGLTLEWGNAAAAEFLQVGRSEFGEFVFADFVPERELPRFFQAIADLQNGVQATASSLLSAEDGVGICRIDVFMEIVRPHLIPKIASIVILSMRITLQ